MDGWGSTVLRTSKIYQMHLIGEGLRICRLVLGISIYSRYPRATHGVGQPLSPVVDTFQPTCCVPRWIFCELEHKNQAALYLYLQL